MLHSLAQDSECLGNMLLHGVGTDAQPVGCLLIGEMLEIAEAENRAGGFLQLPRYLLRLLQQALVLLILGTHIIPGGLYQRLHIGLLHLLVLEPVEAGISHGCVEPASPCFQLQGGELVPRLLENISHNVTGLVAVSQKGHGITHQSRIHFQE